MSYAKVEFKTKNHEDLLKLKSKLFNNENWIPSSEEDSSNIEEDETSISYNTNDTDVSWDYFQSDDRSVEYFIDGVHELFENAGIEIEYYRCYYDDDEYPQCSYCVENDHWIRGYDIVVDAVADDTYWAGFIDADEDEIYSDIFLCERGTPKTITLDTYYKGKFIHESNVKIETDWEMKSPEDDNYTAGSDFDCLWHGMYHIIIDDFDYLSFKSLKDFETTDKTKLKNKILRKVKQSKYYKDELLKLAKLPEDTEIVTRDWSFKISR